MITVDDPRHGTTRGYSAGCHEACCRRPHTRRSKHYKLEHAAGRYRLVDATGSHRRIRALMRIGWPGLAIAGFAGWSTGEAVHQILLRPRVNRRTAAAIARVYDQLSMRPGPSASTRRRAEAGGWPPPLAWDDDTIDDPDAVPWTPEPLQVEVPPEMLEGLSTSQARNSLRGRLMNSRLAELRRAALLEDVEDMLDTGTHPLAIAARLGYQDPESLYRALLRADANDLIRRFSRAVA